MLVGRIFKVPDRRIGWAAECEVACVWTQGPTKQQAMENIAEVVELKVNRRGFKASVTELGPDPLGGITVWIETNDPAAVVALILLEQRLAHKLSLADVAANLQASSRNAYASYERGEREPSITKLRDLLAASAPDIGLVFVHREYLGGSSRGLMPGWKERLEQRRLLVGRRATNATQKRRPTKRVGRLRARPRKPVLKAA